MKQILSDMDEAPLISVCCLTFNHAPYIRKCLDGILMQVISFPIEILIHDDASTDGTDAIVREYADKYPGIIFPLYEIENQFSKGNSSVMDIMYNYSRARGKYIAICEGDDYWTDPLKLQKQLDFMEAHPDYSVCFHRCRHFDVFENSFSEDACGFLFTSDVEGVDLSLRLYFSTWITQPLTMVFRKSSFNAEWQKQYRYYRDTHEIYHLLKNGKGYLFSFVGGVRIKHPGGMSSSVSEPDKRIEIAYEQYHELIVHNPHDSDLSECYITLLKHMISRPSIDWKTSKALLYWRYFVTSKDISFLIKRLIKGLYRT